MNFSKLPVVATIKDGAKKIYSALPLPIDTTLPPAEIPAGSITTDKFAPDAVAPKAVTAETASGVAWSNVSGKPADYPPNPHTHTTAQIDGLAATLAGKLDADVAANIELITDTAGATAEEIAVKLNEIIIAMKGA